MRESLYILVVLALLAGCTAAPEIAQWRGSDRNGIYPDKSLLKEWPQNGPELLWSNESLPQGFSSVSVTEKGVFLTGIVDTMDVLVALNKQGEILWQTPYGKSWTVSFSDSRSTPTVVGNRVYATSGSGVVACLDASNGNVIWSVDTQKEFGARFGTWGCSESPLVVDNKVIFTPAGDKTTLVALDRNNGKTIWQTQSLKDTAAYTSPLLVQENDKQLIITVTGTYLVVVDAKSGEILSYTNYANLKNEQALEVWPGAPYTNTNTPIYNDRKIFITSGYNHVGARYSLSGDYRNLTLDWTNETLDVHHGGVVLVDGYLYGSNWISNARGNWVCISWDTGETMYEKEWFTKGSIISADGLLYCYEERSGNIALVEPTPTDFKVVSTFKVPLGRGPHWSVPAMHQGVLYIRHGNAIMAYNLR